MPELIDLPPKALQTYDDEELCRVCIEPAIVAVRAQPLDVRLRVFAKLTTGQQALLGFWVIYTHGRSGWSALYMQLPHLVGHDEVWSRLVGAAERLGLPDLADSIHAAERVLLSRNPDRRALAELDRQLVQLLPSALKRVAAFIRTHASEFVRAA